MEFTQSYMKCRRHPVHEIFTLLANGEGWAHETVRMMADSALMVMKMSESSMEKEFGTGHPFYVDFWMLKAMLMAFNDQFDEAEALAGEAYALGVRTLGENDADTQRAKQLKHNIATMGSPFDMARELMKGQKDEEVSTATMAMALEKAREILNNPEEAKKWGVSELADKIKNNK